MTKLRKFIKYPSKIKASSNGTFHMSSATFDKMVRENSLMYGLDKSDYDEVRDLADSGKIRRDGLVNTIAVSSNITLDEADKILRKYESITSAQFVPARQLGMFNHRYEVHCDTSSRPDVLLAASDKLENAEVMAKRQIDRIASSPWESKENKLRSLDSLYIYDNQTDDEATTQAVEDYIALSKQRVEKQAVKSSTDVDTYDLQWNDVVNLLNDYKKESDEVIRINDNGVVVTSADDDYTYAASKEYLLDKANSTVDAYQHYMEDPSAIMDLIDEKVVYAEDHRSVSRYRKEKKEILNKYGFGRPSKKVEQSEEVCCNSNDGYDMRVGLTFDIADGLVTYTIEEINGNVAKVRSEEYNGEQEVFECIIKKDKYGRQYLTTEENPHMKLYAGDGYIPGEYADDDYTSAYRGDYSPSNPWDAPGMSYRDFI